MKNIVSLLMLCALCACATVRAPQPYQYTQIHTPAFTVAAWVKQSNPADPFHIYIEGDGRAYTDSGFPSHNPTPKNPILRRMAFEDDTPNVAYLARPCQYVKDPVCSQKDWTSARFSPRVIASVAEAVKQIAGDRPVVFYAHSGGALVSGLIIENYPEIKTQQWITYAGLLNHTSWTQKQKLAPLTGSLDLVRLPSVPQTHYAGAKDKVIPLKLSVLWTGNHNLVILPNATHRGPFTEDEKK